MTVADGIALAWGIVTGVVLVAAAIIDRRTGRIPNRLTYPCLAGGLAVTLSLAITGGTSWISGTTLAVVALTWCAALFAALLVTGRAGGDYKAMACMGVGVAALNLAVHAAAVLIVVVLAARAAGRIKAHTKFRVGPYFAIAYTTTLLAGGAWRIAAATT